MGEDDIERIARVIIEQLGTRDAGYVDADGIEDVLIDGTYNLRPVAEAILKEMRQQQLSSMNETDIWKQASPSGSYMIETYPDGTMTFAQWKYENHQTEQRAAALQAGEDPGERIPPPVRARGNERKEGTA